MLRKKIIFIIIVNIISMGIFASEPIVEKLEIGDRAVYFTVHPVTIKNSNINTIENIVEDMAEMKNGMSKCLKFINDLKLSNSNGVIAKLKQSIVRSIDEAKQQTLSLLGTMWNHKFKIAVSGVISIYLYVLYKVTNMNNYLKKENLWSSWKKGCSIAELLAIPQNDLSNELICKIQSVYIQAEQPTNPMDSFSLFIQGVDLEMKQLKSFKTLCSRISNLGLQDLFPSYSEKKEQIEERIERLVYFKNAFSSWLAEYKLKRLEATGFYRQEPIQS
ncbi:hypothetical protein KAH94_03905 [bacterium]|nr:hypothetical protein [bacterium]